MADNDPFAGLAEWAEKTERKVHRRRLLRRLPAFLAGAVVLGLLAFATPPVWRALTTHYEQPDPVATLPATAPTDPFAGDHGMWLGDVKGYTAWADCAAAARGLPHPGAQPGQLGLGPVRRAALPLPICRPGVGPPDQRFAAASRKSIRRA
jgi:hypothetical protein